MNDKIAKTMLGLCIGYLSVFYVLKFFFPELLIQAITSPTLLRLGEVVNSWIGWSYIINILGVFITFYLFAISCSGKYKFTSKQLIISSCVIIVNILVYYLLPDLYTQTSISSLLFVSWLCGGKFLYTIISFTIHGFLSQFLLSIRGFETIITIQNAINPLSTLILCSEMYLWLILLSIIFYLKEKKDYGISVSSLPQQEC